MGDSSIRDAFLDENGHPNKKYQAYIKYQTAYHNSLEAYHSAYEAAKHDPVKLQMWPHRGIQLQSIVDQALNDWFLKGNKAEVERQVNR